MPAYKVPCICKKYLKTATSSDTLTGIANRQTFFEHYEREWSRALRETEPLSVLMANIDHFKAYNDHYGYKQGDICLRSIAQVIQGALQRPTDFCLATLAKSLLYFTHHNRQGRHLYRRKAA